MMEEKSFLSMYCRLCQAPRYRSTVPLGRKDQVRPELFKALDPEAPPPAEGPARCFICQESLVLLADNKLPPIKKSEPVRRQAESGTTKPELFDPGLETPMPQPYQGVESIEVLFELGPGEEMKSFEDKPTHMLIVTNKRILRVRKS